MRFSLGSARDTQPDADARMARTQEDAALLQEYLTRFTDACAAGDAQAAARWIQQMVGLDPTSGLLRMASSAALKRLGQDAEALAQLGIGLAVDPSNYALHRAMASALVQRGDHVAAAAVLEQGWMLKKKHVRRDQLQDERVRYFDVLDAQGT